MGSICFILVVLGNFVTDTRATYRVIDEQEGFSHICYLVGVSIRFGIKMELAVQVSHTSRRGWCFVRVRMLPCFEQLLCFAQEHL